MRYLLVLLVLAGCQTKPIEEMSYSERKALAEQLTKRCYDQGVKPGSAEFRDCAAVEVQREAYTRRANNERVRRGLRGIGAGLASAGQSYNRSAASMGTNRTVTCRSAPAPAGMAKVSCY